MRELIKRGSKPSVEVYRYTTTGAAARYGVRCDGVVVSDGWMAANRAERVATAVRTAVEVRCATQA